MNWLRLIFGGGKQKTVEEPVQPMQMPNVEEGENIPVLFGSRMIKSPKIAWWGDVNIIKVPMESGGKKS
jgi:hypothetical protein